MTLRVTASSSRDGATSPLGWLWNRMIAAALDRMAGLTTSSGQAGADEIVPVETMFRPMILFLPSSRITPEY